MSFIETLRAQDDSVSADGSPGEGSEGQAVTINLLMDNDSRRLGLLSSKNTDNDNASEKNQAGND